MNIPLWVTIYIMLGFAWAAVSVRYILPAISCVVQGKPIPLEGLPPKQAQRAKEFQDSLRRTLDSSPLPSSWIVPVLATVLVLVCCKRGLLWPYYVARYVIRECKE